MHLLLKDAVAHVQFLHWHTHQVALCYTVEQCCSAFKHIIIPQQVPWELNLAPSRKSLEWVRTASDILTELHESIAHLPTFSPTGQQSDANSSGQVSGPPAPLKRSLWLDGDRGLAISGVLCRVDGQVVYDLRMENETEAPVDGVMIEIMENSFGLQPADEVTPLWRSGCCCDQSFHSFLAWPVFEPTCLYFQVIYYFGCIAPIDAKWRLQHPEVHRPPCHGWFWHSGLNQLACTCRSAGQWHLVHQLLMSLSIT